MRTVKVKLDFCKKNKLEGDLEIKVPHAKDRAMFLKKLNLKMDEETNEVKVSSDVSDLLIGMIEICEESIVGSNIVRNGTKVEVEDLFYDPFYQDLLSEVSNFVINGFNPSKN